MTKAKTTAAKSKTTAVKKTPAKKTTSSKTSTPKKAAVKKVPAPKKPLKKSGVKTVSHAALEPIKKMVRAVEKTLDDNKAKNIITTDLTRKSALADFMIVASGNNARQVAALARYAEEALHKNGAKRCRVEGLPQGDWVIVDSGDVIVHIFRPEVREFYQLERLWTDEPGEATTRRSLA